MRMIADIMLKRILNLMMKYMKNSKSFYKNKKAYSTEIVRASPSTFQVLTHSNVAVIKERSTCFSTRRMTDLSLRLGLLCFVASLVAPRVDQLYMRCVI